MPVRLSQLSCAQSFHGLGYLILITARMIRVVM
jgi:hypothetical protein